MLKLVVLVCLVALGAAQTPTKPNIPETFISEVNAAECARRRAAACMHAWIRISTPTSTFLVCMCSTRITESVIPLLLLQGMVTVRRDRQEFKGEGKVRTCIQLCTLCDVANFIFSCKE